MQACASEYRSEACTNPLLPLDDGGGVGDGGEGGDGGSNLK